MRTAISTSRRNRSSGRFDNTSSIATAGCRSRKLAKIVGNTSAPIISLAVMRTVPRAAPASPEAARPRALAAIAMA
jgi:hypothetical protein